MRTSRAAAGAAVLIEEQGIGATTDLDGKFVLEVAPGDLTVKMSFIGYATLSRKVTVAEGQSLDMGNMTMEVATNDLDEVVVVGYGVQRTRHDWMRRETGVQGTRTTFRRT